MKKIKDWKKFENAQNEDEFDYDYVKQCFIDLIEAGTIEYKYYSFVKGDFVEIVYKKFATSELLGDQDNSFGSIKPFYKIEKYIKSLEETKEVMLDIQAGIERVSEEYPEYKCEMFNNFFANKYKSDFPVVMLYIWDARKGVPSQIK